MSEIRAVVTDLDGTFWTGQEVIDPATRAAVDELERRGIELLIATGRRLQSVRRGLDPAGIHRPAVLMSGALGVDLDTGQEWHRAPFDDDTARAVLEGFRAHDLEPVTYLGHELTEAVAPEHCASAPVHLDSFGSALRREPADDWVEAGGVIGFGVIGCHDERLVRVAQHLAEVANVWHSIDDTYGGWALMIGPPEVTKRTAVEPWCTARGYAREEVLALGDGSNDFALLEWAGVAVAVEDRPTADRPHDAIIPGPHAWANVLDLV